MITLRQLSSKPETIPAITSWYLADLGEARGRQELFTKQAPQRLKVLKEHALIESAVSSNRIEGVTVEQSRIRTIVLGKSHLRDRDEEEVRGYRNALKRVLNCLYQRIVFSGCINLYAEKYGMQENIKRRTATS